MDTLQQVCEDARWYCEHGNLGYDQGQRYTWEQSGYKTGKEVDCSSFAIGIYRKHGYPVGNATYTGNMRSEFCKNGWIAVPNNGSPQLGDVLLNEMHHTAIYIGGGMVAQASRGEAGHRVSGGAAGDQDGWETNVRPYYNYPWDCYLRYVGTGDGAHAAVTSQEANKPARIVCDGLWGYKTSDALQYLKGTPRDGIISGQYVLWQSHLKGCTQGWEFSGNPTGSPAIKALQRELGVTPDGIFGEASIKTLERKYGYLQDGVLDCPSLTIKAMQADFNRRLGYA